MKYRIINKDFDIKNAEYQILKNRGIEDPDEYINRSKDHFNKYDKLDNIQKAVEVFEKHFEKKDKIAILTDVDCDGYCSSAMMYLYIKSLDPNYPVYAIQHLKPKAHGLGQMVYGDFYLEDNTKLFIIPDAGSEDFDQQKEILEEDDGVEDILILDHHECDQGYSKYATVVNNQLSENFDNKALCGAGVVMKFLQALDESMWNFNASQYDDLNAIANIGDIMDSRSYETKYIIDKGLSNIKHPFLLELIKQQAFSLKINDPNEITRNKVMYYITPLISAMVRCGKPAEKELMYKAFTCQNELYDYTKKDGTQVKENVYERATRLCKNVKSAQDRQKTKILEEFEEIIKTKCNVNTDKILFITYDSNTESTLAGIVGAGLASKYKRPVLIGKLDDRGFVSGSGRNYNRFEEQELRTVLNNTELFEYCKGHEGAFGFSIKQENIPQVVDLFNKKYKHVDIEAYYNVDAVFDSGNIPLEIFDVVDKMQNLWGQNIEEPYFAFTNIEVEPQDIYIMKGGAHYKFKIGNVDFIRFNVKPDDKILSITSGWEITSLIIDVVGKVQFNEYNGIFIPQVVIEDFNVVGQK